MNALTIIVAIVAFVALVLLFVEIRRKGPAIAQDAAAMERKAMADLHGLWLDEIKRSRAITDHATQDMQNKLAALGEKQDRLLLHINQEFVPIHQRLGAMSAKIEGMTRIKPLAPFVVSPGVATPESDLPDVNAAIVTAAPAPEPETTAPPAAAAAPDTTKAEGGMAAAGGAPDAVSSPDAGDASA